MTVTTDDKKKPPKPPKTTTASALSVVSGKKPDDLPAPKSPNDLARVNGETVLVPKDHGPCQEDDHPCKNRIDVIVTPFQVLYGGKLICVDCRKKRIQKKAREAIEKLESAAQSARDDANQSKLPF